MNYSVFVLLGLMAGRVSASPLFTASLSDFHWIAALQETELHAVAATERAKSYYHFNKAVEYDPGYFAVYGFGGSYLAVIRSDKDGAEQLLSKGDVYRTTELPQRSADYRRKFWRESWALPLYLAYVQLFEKGDITKAAESFRKASLVPGAPVYLSMLTERLQRPLGMYEVGQKLLQHLIAGTQSDEIKQGYSKQLHNLEIAHFMAIQRDRMEKRLPVAKQDPWGGKLNVDPQGRLATTTSYEPVFGLK